jgi:hypothetical protein
MQPNGREINDCLTEDHQRLFNHRQRLFNRRLVIFPDGECITIECFVAKRAKGHAAYRKLSEESSISVGFFLQDRGPRLPVSLSLVKRPSLMKPSLSVGDKSLLAKFASRYESYRTTV